ncbi:MAG: hypothetical protein SOW22_04325, partial [Candidatus Egerieousia sp.]|nr:hypothetical protein [Candidatus Egerieousia sp.]
MPILGFPMPLSQSSEHKKPDFVLERAGNGGSEGQKRTKTSILCSKCPKMGVPKAKSAQKWQFCARKGKRLRDYVLTPIYEASTFAEKHLKMEELIPVQSASRYRKTIDDYKLR